MKAFNKLLFTVLLCASWLNYASAQYCAGGPTSTVDSNVESVDLVGDNLTINHIGCVNGAGVLGTEDLTSKIADLTPGSIYSLTVQFGTCGSGYAGAGEAWIDWDGNSTFDPSESIGTWTGTPPMAASVFSITVPATPATGITRMRVMQQEGGALPLDPCATYSWGSVMDFGVAIGVTCFPASGLTATNITSSSADLSWTSGSGLSNVEYGPAGFTPGMGTVLTGVTSPQSISGLTACSTFDVYVSDDCGNGDISSSTMGSITTAPAATVVAPYSYGFEDGTFSCWTQSTMDTADWFIGGPGSTGSPDTGPSAPASGQSYAYIEASTNIMPNTGDNAILISPNLDINGLTAPGLSFEYNMNGAAIGTLNVSVEAPAGSGNLTNVWSLSGDQGDVWSLVEVDLSAYSGTIAVHFDGSKGAGFTSDISIDNFAVKEISCVAPSGFMITALSATNVSATWNGASTDFFEITGFADGVQISGTPIVLPGNVYAAPVIPETVYEVYLRKVCGPGDTSSYVGPFTFVTPCGVKTAPYTQSFEDGGILNLCWEQSAMDVLDWTVQTGPTGSGGTGPSGAASGQHYVYIESSSPALEGDSAILISPEIDLSALTNPMLDFQYHMFGLAIGELRVEAENPVGSGAWSTIWSLSGDQGDEWFSGKVDLAGLGTTTKVRFTGVISADPTLTPPQFQSDFAIDSVSFVEAPLDDLALTDVDAGDDGCGVGNSPVMITIDNNGLFPISNVPVSFTVNGGTMVTEIVAGPIPGFGSMDYTFATNANITQSGDNEVAVMIMYPADPNGANNADTVYVYNQPIVNTFPYNMSWEGGNAGWATNGDWELGAPAGAVINSASAGTQAYVTNLVGNYSDGLISDLTSPCFDFSGFTSDAILTADVWYDIETDWDGAYVEMSIDDGTTWTKVGTVNDPTWYNNTNANGAIGDCFNGAGVDGSQGWVTVTNVLSGSAGLANAKIRFTMESDANTNNEGFGVDNVSITQGCPMTLNLNGTSTDETVAGNADGSAMVASITGYTYLWSNAATTAAITGLTPGAYSVTATDANGCMDDTTFTIGTTCPVSLGLSTTSNPEIGAGTNSGTATVAASAGTAPYTYAWSNGTTNDFATGLTTGTYEVTVTDANGCMGTDSAVVGLEFLIATNEIEGLKGIAITPNPTQDVTLLQVEFEKSVDLTIEVIDIMGRVLQTRNEGSVVSEQFRLDLSKYAAGTYFIKLSANGQVMTRPVVLMK